MGKKKKSETASEQAVMSHFEDLPFPYRERLNKKEYNKTLLRLQIEMVKMQRWVKSSGQRVLIIFEGRDAAGKGGTIKRFTEHLNPRGAPVVALSKPTDAERGQWYFQRYIAHLPTEGEIVFFDRSWYNRAGVEPVMGFCSPMDYMKFMRQVPDLERALIDSGLKLYKLWFAVSREEQKTRFQARQSDPLKQWKLSPIDEQALGKWDEYTAARNRMFFFTHTNESPWMVIRSDDKRRARINAMRHVLADLDYTDKSSKVVDQPDPKIVGPAESIFPEDDDLVIRLSHR